MGGENDRLQRIDALPEPQGWRESLDTTQLAQFVVGGVPIGVGTDGSDASESRGGARAAGLHPGQSVVICSAGGYGQVLR